MKLSKHRPHNPIAFNMTPMIDIVFLLIIFFMTVSQITRVADYPLALPRVSQGDSSSITATVTINLNREGEIRRRRVLLDLLLQQQSVGTQINKFLACHDALDDLWHLLMNERLAARNRYDRCTTFINRVQRIVYASRETNYCPGCQTDGKILRDRSLSRLLKDDWPATLDEL